MNVGGTPTRSMLRKGEDWLENRIVAIWSNLLTNHLWERMLKNTVATTITVILATIPAVAAVYGKAIYLAPITTVFGHPGRRLGMMAEALILAITGTLLGIGWSVLGIYLSSLVYDRDRAAAYTIKGLFLAIALMFHGFLRSHTPRLFIFVLLMIIVSVVSLTGTSTSVSLALVTNILYPIATAAGILLLVNVLIYPEFSSSFLGITTIETLADTVEALREAGNYFAITGSDLEAATSSAHRDEALDRVHYSDTSKSNSKSKKEKQSNDTPDEVDEVHKVARPAFFLRVWTRVFPKPHKEDEGSKQSHGITIPNVQLAPLSAKKAKLRAKLAACKSAQTECNFELAFAALPPRDLKAISDTAMKKLVANTIALIGACESKYALIGDDSDVTKADGITEDTKESAEQAIVEPPEVNSDKAESPVDESSGEGAESLRKRQKPTDRGRKRSLWAELVDHTSDDEEKKERKRERKDRSKRRAQRELKDLELVKPRKEIEFGDVGLLKFLVRRITNPLCALQSNIDESVNTVASCLAYCYDVERLPSGARPPRGIKIEELDIRIESLAIAVIAFDNDTSEALERTATLHNTQGPELDVMPRMETFLVSSFLLNLRQAAFHTKEMLIHVRDLVERRQARNGRRRIWLPRIKWRKWLTSGGEQDEFALPEQGRREARKGKIIGKGSSPPTTTEEDVAKQTSLDIESASGAAKADGDIAMPNTSKMADAPKHRKIAAVQFRNNLADFVEFLAGSEDVVYALKLTFAVFLVSWPAFIADWNTWFSLNRGLWAALQLVLITEVAIGTSVMTFFLRAVGTSLGCLWGYAAYIARDGNPYVIVVLLVIGIIPSAYIQLGSKYIKAGMVSIISMCIVALATEVQTVPGSATENFLKRFIAFLIGGVVALVVEVVIFPVRARDRLVESLASSIMQISEMEACVAYGIETEVNVDVHSIAVSERFDNARSRAQAALTAAETFLPFCAQEPRLKGSFKGLALVYAEILYVLHQIVDKMDNMLQLRKAYGSGVLEDLNAEVFAYRRNVAASITLILFAVHEALTTKLALPQFLPSARLAHLRMVNRVREVVLLGGNTLQQRMEEDEHHGRNGSHMKPHMVKQVIRQKFLSWNAASAGQIEIIEYLEELVDLTKLLVGANEFRSGMLTRPTYRQYVEKIAAQTSQSPMDEKGKREERRSNVEREREELRDVVSNTTGRAPSRRLGMTTRSGVEHQTSDTQTALRHLASIDSRTSDKEDSLPLSLQRVRSRRVEQVRSRENSSWTTGRERQPVRLV